MIIYHIHKGINDVGNSINVTHPQRMYPVAQNASQDPTGLGTYGSINNSTAAWSGFPAKTEFSDNSIPSAKSWLGNNSYKPITGIVRNAAAKTVSFTFMGGNTCTPPTTQATNLIASNIQENSVTLNWTRGNGDKVLVLARKKNTITTTPLNGKSFNANNAMGKGTLIDANTYVVYDGVGTSVTVNDLLKNSIYYFAVYEYKTMDTCYLSNPLIGNFTTIGCATCIPTSTSSSFGIKNVSINNINNASSARTSYSDYSETITELIPGNSYNLVISNDSYTNTMYTKAWIDWNKDCNFQTSEEYDFGASTNDAVLTKSIVVPLNAFGGVISLRVRSSLNSTPLPCGDKSYSEAEDYSLKIANNCVAPSISASNFSASAIQEEQINISWTRGNGDSVLVLARAVSPVNEIPFGIGVTANAEFKNGSKIGVDTYVVYIGKGKNFTLTGLIPSTTYHFAIYEIKSTNFCLSTVLTGNASTQLGISYCVPTFVNDGGMGITNVVFNSINNASSGSPAYTDFKTIKTTVEKGLSYSLELKISTSGNNLCRSKAWIDWNKNGTFDIPAEEYDLGSAQNVTNSITSLSPLSIVVPLNAQSGITTMRIRTRFSTHPTSCNSNDYSEAEDYSIKVINSVNVNGINETTPNQAFKVYLNASNQVVIENNTDNLFPAEIKLFNLIGETIYTSKTTDKITKINKSFISGIYFVRIKVNEKLDSYKIIVNK